MAAIANHAPGDAGEPDIAAMPPTTNNRAIASGRRRVPPELIRRQVFELTEHLPVESSLALHKALEPLRATGVRLALDDAGSGFFNMDMARALRPEIVKLCHPIVQRLGQGRRAGSRLTEMVRKLKLLGCQVLGEGIERKTQARILREAEVRLGQGFLFSHPRPAADVIRELA